jgi:hypothetical protein
MFTKHKKNQGQRIDDVAIIEHNAVEYLLVTPKTESERCFQHRQQQWNKCVSAEGAYFEGD